MTGSYAWYVARLQAHQLRGLTEGSPDPRFVLTRDRTAMARFLIGAGARHPRVLAVVPARDLSARLLATPVALKPVAAHVGGASVLLLSPTGGAGWWETRAGTRIAADKLAKHLDRVAGRYALPDRWVVQEREVPPLVTGHLTPVEYRCLTVAGDVMLIMGYRAERGRRWRRWYTPRWRAADDVEATPVAADERVEAPPVGLRERVLTLARGVAARVPWPSVRVDVWLTAHGLAVGGIADHDPTPLSPYWDRRLGELLTDARVLR